MRTSKMVDHLEHSSGLLLSFQRGEVGGEGGEGGWGGWGGGGGGEGRRIQLYTEFETS